MLTVGICEATRCLLLSLAKHSTTRTKSSPAALDLDQYWRGCYSHLGLLSTPSCVSEAGRPK